MTTSSDSKETKDIGYSFFLYRQGALQNAFTISLDVPAADANPCAWDPLDLDSLFDGPLGLACCLRSCALATDLATGDEVTSWPDESGSGNDMTDVSSTPVPVFDGSSVVFNRDAATLQCQDAYTFHADEWTWFLTLHLSDLSDPSALDRLILRVFSVTATFSPRTDRTLGVSWADYRDEEVAASLSGVFSEAETGGAITDWLSRVILCVRARVVGDTWTSALRLNGQTVRTGGINPYSDARRTVSLAWEPAASGHVMTLRHVLGFDRYLDDAACASVETILKKYA